MSNSEAPSVEPSALQEDLAQALEALKKFQVTCRPNDIDTAIASARLSVDKTSKKGAESQIHALTVLGACLQRRYQHASSNEGGGTIYDIDEMVEASKAALEQLILNPPERSNEHLSEKLIYFENMERALLFRQSVTKTTEEVITQLDRGVQIVNQVIALASQQSCDDGALYHNYALRTLSSLYNRAYEQTKDERYLDKAIDRIEYGLCIAGSETPGPSRTILLESLSDLLDERSERTQTLPDLDSFINICDELAHDVRLKGSLKYSIFIQNLAAAFTRRHSLTGDPVDLAMAIEYGQSAVESIPATMTARRAPISPRKFALHKLRMNVQAYFKLTERIPKFNEEILDSLNIEGIARTSADMPPSVSLLKKLANAFHSLYESTHRVVDVEYAIMITAHVMQLMKESDEEWSIVADDFRARLRLWSEETGKMPGFEISVLGFEGSGGTWLPAELAEGLELKFPYFIFGGEIDSDTQGDCGS